MCQAEIAYTFIMSPGGQPVLLYSASGRVAYFKRSGVRSDSLCFRSHTTSFNDRPVNGRLPAGREALFVPGCRLEHPRFGYGRCGGSRYLWREPLRMKAMEGASCIRPSSSSLLLTPHFPCLHREFRVLGCMIPGGFAV